MKKNKYLAFSIILVVIIGILSGYGIALASIFTKPQYILVTQLSKETGKQEYEKKEVILDEKSDQFSVISDLILKADPVGSEKSFDRNADNSITVALYENKQKKGGLYWAADDPSLFYIHYGIMNGFYTFDDEQARQKLVETVASVLKD